MITGTVECFPLYCKVLFYGFYFLLFGLILLTDFLSWSYIFQLNSIAKAAFGILFAQPTTLGAIFIKILFLLLLIVSQHYKSKSDLKTVKTAEKSRSKLTLSQLSHELNKFSGENKTKLPERKTARIPVDGSYGITHSNSNNSKPAEMSAGVKKSAIKPNLNSDESSKLVIPVKRRKSAAPHTKMHNFKPGNRDLIYREDTKRSDKPAAQVSSDIGHDTQSVGSINGNKHIVPENIAIEPSSIIKHSAIHHVRESEKPRIPSEQVEPITSDLVSQCTLPGDLAPAVQKPTVSCDDDKIVPENSLDIEDMRLIIPEGPDEHINAEEANEIQEIDQSGDLIITEPPKIIAGYEDNAILDNEMAYTSDISELDHQIERSKSGTSDNEMGDETNLTESIQMTEDINASVSNDKLQSSQASVTDILPEQTLQANHAILSDTGFSTEVSKHQGIDDIADERTDESKELGMVLNKGSISASELDKEQIKSTNLGSTTSDQTEEKSDLSHLIDMDLINEHIYDPEKLRMLILSFTEKEKKLQKKYDQSRKKIKKAKADRQAYSNLT